VVQHQIGVSISHSPAWFGRSDAAESEFGGGIIGDRFIGPNFPRRYVPAGSEKRFCGGRLIATRLRLRRSRRRRQKNPAI